MVKRQILVSAVVIAFLWPASTQAEIVYKLVDLGTLGGSTSWARCINNAGQIVGEAMQSQGGVYAATLFDSTGAGNNIDLGTLGGRDSWATSISDAGQIVGRAEDSHQWARATLFDPTGAGNNLDLGTLGGGVSSASSINDAGQIVGQASDSDWYERATLFDPTGDGNNVDLGALPGNTSGATSINNNGQIGGWLGWEQQGRVYDKRPILFDPTGSGNNLDVGTIGGLVHSISDVGQIVGVAGYATLFDSTGAGNNIDLNTLIDPASGWTLLKANDINSSGWIVGRAWNTQGKVRAFLLVPRVPCQYRLAGDLNDDCKVDFADLALMAANWLVDCEAEPTDPACVPK